MIPPSIEPWLGFSNLNRCNRVYGTLNLPVWLFLHVWLTEVFFSSNISVLSSHECVITEPSPCDHEHLHKKKDGSIQRCCLSFDPVLPGSVTCTQLHCTVPWPAHTHTQAYLLLWHQRPLDQLIITPYHSTEGWCCPWVPIPEHTATTCHCPLEAFVFPQNTHTCDTLYFLLQGKLRWIPSLVKGSWKKHAQSEWIWISNEMSLQTKLFQTGLHFLWNSASFHLENN